MKGLNIFILLIFFYCSAFGQAEFSIIKTDDSDYPKISLLLRVDSGSLSESNLKVISENNKEIEYNLSKTSGLNYDKELTVLMLLFPGSATEPNDSIKQSLTNFLKETKSSYKLNVACVKSENDEVKLKFLSPEFSLNYNFFTERLNEIKIQSDTLAEAGEAIHRAMEKIESDKTKPANFSLFLIGNSFLTKEDDQLIHRLVQSDIHVYGVLNDSLSAENENALIALCGRTGGMYTKSDMSDFSNNLEKYSEDALIYAAVSGFEFFKVEFEMPSKSIKNYGIISNGEKEIPFIVYGKRMLGKVQIYQLLMLLLLIVLAYFVLMYFVQKRKVYYYKIKSRRSETIPKPNKKVVLNIQGVGFSEKIILENDKYTLGRHESNDIVIKNATVSSFHVEIVKESGLYYIIDKGSTNGTILDGKHIVKEVLRRSAQLKLGEIYIKVSYE